MAHDPEPSTGAACGGQPRDLPTPPPVRQERARLRRRGRPWWASPPPGLRAAGFALGAPVIGLPVARSWDLGAASRPDRAPALAELRLDSPAGGVGDGPPCSTTLLTTLTHHPHGQAGVHSRGPPRIRPAWLISARTRFVCSSCRALPSASWQGQHQSRSQPPDPPPATSTSAGPLGVTTAPDPLRRHRPPPGTAPQRRSSKGMLKDLGNVRTASPSRLNEGCVCRNETQAPPARVAPGSADPVGGGPSSALAEQAHWSVPPAWPTVRRPYAAHPILVSTAWA